MPPHIRVSGTVRNGTELYGTREARFFSEIKRFRLDCSP